MSIVLIIDIRAKKAEIYLKNWQKIHCKHIQNDI